MTAYPHVHASGRYTCNVGVFARYVVAAVSRTRARSFTCTERYGNLATLPAELRKRLGDGWIVVGGGEYVVGVRRDTYRHPKTRRPRNRPSTNGRGRRLSWVYTRPEKSWMDTWSYERMFIHLDTHRPVLFAPLHIPKVEHGDADQRRAAWAGLKRAGRRVARYLRVRHRGVVITGTDTNGDHHDNQLRRGIEDALDMESCWTHQRPDRGTHGPRLIDAVYSTAPTSNGRVPHIDLPDCADHYAVVCDVHIDDDRPARAARHQAGATRRTAEIPT